MTTSSIPNPIPDISVIILNYKTADYTLKCLTSIFASDLKQLRLEIVLVDNFSHDGSWETIQKTKFSHPHISLKYLSLDRNYGFAAGNNRGIAVSHPRSKYVAFVNSDVIVSPDTFYKMYLFFKNKARVDAATCYVRLAKTGRLQPECHRGFPTPLNTFWHFFGLGIPKLFPKTAFFHGYLMDHLDYTQIQRIDCCVGAFFMMKRQVGETVGWWNEKYFFYGEDLDFCYKLRSHHFRLYFYPHTQVIHYQGISSGLIGHSQKTSTADRATRIRAAQASTAAMKIFIQENLLNKYPLPLRWLLLSGINFLAAKRYLKARFY